MSGASTEAISAVPERPLAVPAQDLRGHHAHLLAELTAAAARVLASGKFVLGGGAAEVRAFEDEAASAFGVSHAIGVSSGTDALLAMLMASGVGPDDEVVTTPFSFFATAGAIARLGARPVFADVEPDTLTLNPESAARRVGPRTKAVLTVHLFGRVAHTQALESVCKQYGIPLLEDAAQAVMAEDGLGRRTGRIGLAAALSFFPTKNLGGFGDGGMILTDDARFAEAARTLRVQGAIRRSHHRFVGGNFRLDELQAALLRVKLPHLPEWTAARRRIAGMYRVGLSDTPMPLRLPPDDPGCVWNQFVVQVPTGLRDALAAHLAAREIATAIYYPEPLHLQPCFAGLGHRASDFPVAEQACRDVLALPLYPELTTAQVDHVIEAIRGWCVQQSRRPRPQPVSGS